MSISLTEKEKENIITYIYLPAPVINKTKPTALANDMY